MVRKLIKPWIFLLSISAIALVSCRKNAAQERTGTNSSNSVPVYGTNESNSSLIKLAPDSNAKEGLNVIRYKNGVIKAQGNYKSGYKTGEWQSFYESGKLWSDEYFTSGLPDGKVSVYYDNGQMMYQGQYKNGRPVGGWTYWGKNGQVVRKEDYNKKPANTAF